MISRNRRLLSVIRGPPGNIARSVVFGSVRIAQRPMCSIEVGQVEAVVAVDADVGADERREPRGVGLDHRVLLSEPS